MAPLTALIEYTFPELPEQTLAEPEIIPGVTGLGETVTGKMVVELAPHALFAVTLTFPEMLPKFMEAEVFPCPAGMLEPDGTPHV